MLILFSLDSAFYDWQGLPEVVFRNGVSRAQSSVFRFLKMWYDVKTARLDRFSHIALKRTLGLKNVCSFFRFALFDGEIYPLESISKGWTDTFLVVIYDKMFILVHHLSVGIIICICKILSLFPGLTAFNYTF